MVDENNMLGKYLRSVVHEYLTNVRMIEQRGRSGAWVSCAIFIFSRMCLIEKLKKTALATNRLNPASSWVTGYHLSGQFISPSSLQPSRGDMN